MVKIIKYQFVSSEDVVLDKEMMCPTQEVYDVCYPIAESEAIPGTIEVKEE